MNPGTPTRTTVTVGDEEITYWESPRQKIGISYNDPSSRREWLFWGSLDRDVIIGVAQAMLPAVDTCAGVARFYQSHDVEEKGGGAWSVTANYRSKPAQRELTITNSGATAKRLQSYQTLRGYSALGIVPHEIPEDWIDSGAIPDFKRAIGVNGSTIDGVDIVVPKFDFSLNYKFSVGALSSSYLTQLFKTIGKINDADFTIDAGNGQTLTFRAGDLLLTGAPTKQTSDNQLDVTFNFSASKGLAGGTKITTNFVQPVALSDVVVDVDSTSLFTVGQYVYVVAFDNGVRYEGGEYRVTAVDAVNYQITINNLGSTGSTTPGELIEAVAYLSADRDDRDPLVIGESGLIKKSGWDYLWVHYAESQDAATGRKTKTPVAVYVERVYQTANFDDLGIV